MKLLFEKSVHGRKCCILPECDVPEYNFSASLTREKDAKLP